MYLFWKVFCLEKLVLSKKSLSKGFQMSFSSQVPGKQNLQPPSPNSEATGSKSFPTFVSPSQVKIFNQLKISTVRHLKQRYGSDPTLLNWFWTSKILIIVSFEGKILYSQTIGKKIPQTSLASTVKKDLHIDQNQNPRSRQLNRNTFCKRLIY